MALHVLCSVCEEELREPGALLFSPPTANGPTVLKNHLCQNCHLEIVKFCARRSLELRAKDEAELRKIGASTG